MSLCDTCIDPGHCCRSLVLSMTFPLGTHRDIVARVVREVSGVPFVPLAQAGVWGNDPAGSTRWSFSCPNLTRSGKCGIYPHRPDVCRTYEPGSDYLCIHYSPDELSPLQQQTDLLAQKMQLAAPAESFDEYVQLESPR